MKYNFFHTVKTYGTLLRIHVLWTPFAFQDRILRTPFWFEGRKNVAAEFPGAIRRTFCRSGEVNRSHSTDSPLLPRGGGRMKGAGGGWGDQGWKAGGSKGGRVLEERTGLANPASASADVEFTLLLLLLKPFDFSFPCTRAPPANSKSH